MNRQLIVVCSKVWVSMCTLHTASTTILFSMITTSSFNQKVQLRLVKMQAKINASVIYQGEPLEWGMNLWLKNLFHNPKHELPTYRYNVKHYDISLISMWLVSLCTCQNEDSFEEDNKQKWTIKLCNSALLLIKLQYLLWYYQFSILKCTIVFFLDSSIIYLISVLV